VSSGNGKETRQQPWLPDFDFLTGFLDCLATEGEHHRLPREVNGRFSYRQERCPFPENKGKNKGDIPKSRGENRGKLKGTFPNLDAFWGVWVIILAAWQELSWLLELRGGVSAMTTMNISLPDEMKAFVEAQMARDGYASASEYLRALIREDQKEKVAGGRKRGAFADESRPDPHPPRRGTCSRGEKG
jgi:hypothetical protein